MNWAIDKVARLGMQLGGAGLQFIAQTPAAAFPVRTMVAVEVTGVGVGLTKQIDKTIRATLYRGGSGDIAQVGSTTVIHEQKNDSDLDVLLGFESGQTTVHVSVQQHPTDPAEEAMDWAVQIRFLSASYLF
jgi:hypothetical protein